MIKFKKKFLSYEGEGPNIGKKTLFVMYEDGIGEETVIDEDYLKVGAVYINAEKLTPELEDFINLVPLPTVTLEISSNNLKKEILERNNLAGLKSLYATLFVRVEEYCDLEDDTEVEELYDLSKLSLDLILKIEMFASEDFIEKITLANKYSKYFSVYLMPLFSSKTGELMMKHFDLINNQVKVMPPTQFLIKMK